MGQRLKDHQWTVSADQNGEYGFAGAHLVVLMDLRDELKEQNRLFRNLPCIVTTLKSMLRQLKLQRRCPVHPRYTGARPPRVQCRACRRFYKAVWK